MGYRWQFMLAVLFAVLAIACGKAATLGARVVSDSLHDGVYQGRHKSFPNSAEVEVTIEAGRIERVELLRHGASWIGGKAESVIPQRIVDEQSTAVDVVSGATNSSRVIMNAVQDALEKAELGGEAKSDE